MRGVMPIFGFTEGVGLISCSSLPESAWRILIAESSMLNNLFRRSCEGNPKNGRAMLGVPRGKCASPRSLSSVGFKRTMAIWPSNDIVFWSCPERSYSDCNSTRESISSGISSGNLSATHTGIRWLITSLHLWQDSSFWPLGARTNRYTTYRQGSSGDFRTSNPPLWHSQLTVEKIKPAQHRVGGWDGEVATIYHVYIVRIDDYQQIPERPLAHYETSSSFAACCPGSLACAMSTHHPFEKSTILSVPT